MRNVRIRSIGLRTFNEDICVWLVRRQSESASTCCISDLMRWSFATHGTNELGLSLEEFMFIIIAAIIQIVSK